MLSFTEGAALAALAVNVLAVLAALAKLARWTGVVDTRLAELRERLDRLPCGNGAACPISKG